MSIFTVKGRVQTKIMTYVILAMVTIIVSAVTKQNFWLLFALALPVGLALETLWGFIVSYQPGWMTIFFGILEFIGITAIAVALGLPFTLLEAGLYYLISWSVIQFFLIYIMPILRLSWSDNGGELW